MKHEEQNREVKERFQKVCEWKKLASKFRRVRARCPRPQIVPVLRIQKFSNFALYVINKKSQWILIKLRINAQEFSQKVYK